jgi:hypothetical protein
MHLRTSEHFSTVHDMPFCIEEFIKQYECFTKSKSCVSSVKLPAVQICLSLRESRTEFRRRGCILGYVSFPVDSNQQFTELSNVLFSHTRPIIVVNGRPS